MPPGVSFVSEGLGVTLFGPRICDPGERYLASYYDQGWIAAEGLDPRPFRDWLEGFSARG